MHTNIHTYIYTYVHTYIHDLLASRGNIHFEDAFIQQKKAHRYTGALLYIEQAVKPNSEIYIATSTQTEINTFNAHAFRSRKGAAMRE
jgi:hypothetical protein